jgi:hypothetical protein
MYVIVETFRARGEASSSPVRVRPVPGQGYSPDTRVECSKGMRTSAPIGSRFRIWVKETRKEGGKTFLYSNPRDPWERVL